MGIRYMTATEARRALSAVIAEVMRTGVAVIVTRRGRPVVKIMPEEEAVDEVASCEAISAADPLSEETFAEFERVMKHVLALRRSTGHGRAPESDE